VKLEARLFLILAVFCWIAAGVYAYWTGTQNPYGSQVCAAAHSGSCGKVEPVGVVALILSGGLLGIAGSFFWFVSRRIDARPEDRVDAEIAEAAGELGFFSPGSYWPIGLAGAATLAGLGLAFVQAWLVLVGALLLLFMIGGLVFEYYVGGRRQHH
jgi:hypothetical protein